MAALTADKNTPSKEGGRLQSVPLLANAIVFKGGFVSLVVASGFAQAAGDDAGTIFVGVAEDNVDNTGGANGDKSVQVDMGSVRRVVSVGLAQADLLKDAYLLDDQSVALIGGVSNNIVMGRITEFISATEVYVKLRDQAAA